MHSPESRDTFFSFFTSFSFFSFLFRRAIEIKSCAPHAFFFVSRFIYFECKPPYTSGMYIPVFTSHVVVAVTSGMIHPVPAIQHGDDKRGHDSGARSHFTRGMAGEELILGDTRLASTRTSMRDTYLSIELD